MQKKLTMKSSYMARLAESFRFLSSSNNLVVLSSISLSLSAACLLSSARSSWVFALSFSIVAYNTTPH
jgi:hypothetical protein